MNFTEKAVNLGTEIDHQIIGTTAVVPDNAGKAVLKRVYCTKIIAAAASPMNYCKTQDWCRKTISARSVLVGHPV